MSSGGRGETVKLLLTIFVVFGIGLPSRAEIRELAYAPAPPDNPLKGLVPYSGDHGEKFPHSLEFNYLPLRALMTGAEKFDWRPLDQLLDDVASRGHQTIFRIYLEYPGIKQIGAPQFLLDAGLKTFSYKHGKDEVTTPDYTDPRLRTALTNFIRALGKRYDGDSRIGYITAGLLGQWGEWHDYPREDLFATKEVQREVMEAYATAFPRTPVLLRYPAGDNHPEYEPNDRRPFGYHDDSFAWATLETGKKNDDWYYLALLQRAGPVAIEKWKTHPVGGEIRPELWGRIFDANPKHKHAQDFAKCVAETHVTWLMDTGMFRKKQTAEQRARAIEQVRRMGYEFHIATADFPAVARAEKLSVALTVHNKGVAPFYADWRLELGAMDTKGELIRTWPTDWKLTGLLPADPPRRWETAIDVVALPPGRYRLLLRVANPLPNGLPLRFANATQDADRAGWLTLGEFMRP